MKTFLGILVGNRESPKPAPQPVLEALQRLQVTQGDGGQPGDYQQGFELSLLAGRGTGANSDYDLLSDPLLDPGQRIIITITLNATLRVLFDGVIAHRELTPGSTAGQSILILKGRDISLLMDLDEKDRTFTAKQDDAIARSILEEYKKFGVSAEVSSPSKSWTPEEKEGFVSQHSTDRKYLQGLARRNGFIFQIKPGPKARESSGYWGPLDYSDRAQIALTTNMGAATNIQSLNFSENALAPAKVTGMLYNKQDEETTPIDIEQSSQPTALAKSPQLAADSAFVRTLRLIYSGVSAVEAQTLAQAVTNRSSESALRVTGSLDTAQYGEILVAPGKVGLRGAGMRRDGEYYVRKVTHDITPIQYKQHFELTREGLGSLVREVTP